MKTTLNLRRVSLLWLAGVWLAGLEARAQNCIALTCPTNIVACCQGTNGAVVTYDVRATNTCGGTNAVTLVCVPPSGSTFGPGSRTVFCQASLAQQTNTCSFSVNVVGNCSASGSPQILFDSLTNQHVTQWFVGTSNLVAFGFRVGAGSDFDLASITLPVMSFSAPTTSVDVAVFDSFALGGLNPGARISGATLIVSNTLVDRTFSFNQPTVVRSGKQYWIVISAVNFIQVFDGRIPTENGLRSSSDLSTTDNGLTWRGPFANRWGARIVGRPTTACVRLDGPTNVVAACQGGYEVPVNYPLSVTNRCLPSDLLLECHPSTGSRFLPGTVAVWCEARSTCESDRFGFTVTVPDDNCSPAHCSDTLLLDNLPFPPVAVQNVAANGNGLTWIGMGFSPSNDCQLTCLTTTLSRDNFTCSESLPLLHLHQGVSRPGGVFVPGPVLRTLPPLRLVTPVNVPTNCLFTFAPPVALAARGVYFVTWETQPNTQTCYNVVFRRGSSVPGGFIANGASYVNLASSFGQETNWFAISGSSDHPGLRLEVQAIATCAFQCPTDQVLQAQSPEGAVASFAPSLTGPCVSNTTVVCVPPSGTTFPPGTNQVRCTATGPQGASNNCTFQITVLAAPCCDGKEWAQSAVNPTNSPSARQGHAMAYDVARSQTVLFGGNAGALLNETWRWNGTAWSQAVVAGPSARELTAMAYDRNRSRLVLFGGNTSNGPVADTWEWDGSQWFSRNISGPSARHSHAMAYDPARARIVLYGGRGSNDLADTWEYDGTNWIVMPVVGPSPGPRMGHAMSWDGAAVLAFGGAGEGVFSTATWAWDGLLWRLAQTNGPPPRLYLAMAFDDSCARVVLFGGGTTPTNLLADTWEWNRLEWTSQGSGPPAARRQHALAHDSARNQTVTFGGSTGLTRSRETWLRNRDQTPPVLVSASATCGDRQVCLTFSEPVEPTAALQPSNYRFLDGSGVVSILPLSQDGRVVCLTLAKAFTAGVTNTVTVSNIVDHCGNVGSSQLAFTCEPCTEGNSGTGFWLTFPGNYPPELTNEPSPQLFITGVAGTAGTVAVPGLTPPFSTNFTIPPSGPAIIFLPRNADLSDTNELVLSRGVRVDTSANVNVYGYNRVPFSTDGYLALPTNALGKAYLVMSYGNTVTNVPELAGTQLAIVGTEDGTIVSITPASAVGVHPAGVPFNVVLERGSTYQLRDLNNPPADLTGTLVVADRPIAVFGSHACATIPSGDVFFCNHIVEQIPPAHWWGAEFVTMPLAGRTNGDTFRVLALLDNTSVLTNGIVAVSGLGAGEFFEMRLTNVAHVVANNPVLLAQFAHSSRFDRVRNSDPTMVLVPPTRLFGSRYDIPTPTDDFATNFLNVVVPSGAVGQVLFDGVALPAGSFVPIAASGYFGLRKHIPPGLPGLHTLRSINGQTFGVIAYGWGEYDAYSYPAGFCVPPPVAPPQFSCPPGQDLLYTDGNCQARVPDYRVLVGNRAAAVLITQAPAPGTLLTGPGAFSIVTTIFDSSGQSRSCTTALTVTDTNLLRCPSNIITGCTEAGGTRVAYAVPRSCDTNIVIDCVPPPGELLPLGTNVVTCTSRFAGNVVQQCSFTVEVRLASPCQALTVDRVGDKFVIKFPPGGTLFVAPTFPGPFVPVQPATSPYSIPVSSSPQGFYIWSTGGAP